jgi:hypothetical protein
VKGAADFVVQLDHSQGPFSEVVVQTYPGVIEQSQYLVGVISHAGCEVPRFAFAVAPTSLVAASGWAAFGQQGEGEVQCLVVRRRRARATLASTAPSPASAACSEAALASRSTVSIWPVQVV